MFVFTDIKGLDLESGLKQAIAIMVLDLPAADIPLGLCFRRQGLGYRSAIALKLAANQPQSPASLAQVYLAQLTAQKQPTDLSQYWCYRATVTPEGWLEFWLEPPSLATWLDICEDSFATFKPHQFSEQVTQIPDLFRFQYLQVRCRQLTKLADNLQPRSQQQWFFERSELPDWEQTLVDCLVRFRLRLAQGIFSERLLLQLDHAVWNFHRHCPLFAWQRTQPKLFAHYQRWLQLIQVVFVACLENIYAVPAIATF